MNYIQKYAFNLKDEKGLVNTRTLKAELKLIQKNITLLLAVCLILGWIAVDIEFRNGVPGKEIITTKNIGDYIIIFIIVTKIFLVLCYFLSFYVGRYTFFNIV